MTHQKSIQLREFKSNTMEQLNKMNYVPQVNKPMQESMVVPLRNCFDIL